jgi:hypothetical protein
MLYPGRPHLAKYARNIGNGWWMATNFSERDIARAAHSACRIAGVTYGKDVVVEWQQSSPPNERRSPTLEDLGLVSAEKNDLCTAT